MNILGNIKDSVVLFFTGINYKTLWKSFVEVLWLTVLAVIPLLVNTIIASIEYNSMWEGIRQKLIPGEFLSYSFSFLAPSLYLFLKANDTGYRLPLLHAFSLIALVLYGLSIGLYLVTKNKWGTIIDTMPHEFDLYYKLAIVSLATTIVLRFYAVYHARNMINFSRVREQQQNNFSAGFVKSLNERE
jgi:hypothetical protein